MIVCPACDHRNSEDRETCEQDAEYADEGEIQLLHVTPRVAVVHSAEV